MKCWTEFTSMTNRLFSSTREKVPADGMGTTTTSREPEPVDVFSMRSVNADPAGAVTDAASVKGIVRSCAAVVSVVE